MFPFLICGIVFVIIIAIAVVANYLMFEDYNSDLETVFGKDLDEFETDKELKKIV